jgi:hypothetical protein
MRGDDQQQMGVFSYERQVRRELLLADVVQTPLTLLRRSRCGSRRTCPANDIHRSLGFAPQEGHVKVSASLRMSRLMFLVVMPDWSGRADLHRHLRDGLPAHCIVLRPLGVILKVIHAIGDTKSIGIQVAINERAQTNC